MFENEIRSLMDSLGVADTGFSKPEDGPLPYAISIAAKLSDSIIEEVFTAPTHSYFHHYRTVNFFLDQAMLRLGNYLESKGFKYIPVAASQSINVNGSPYEGRYSHKKAAYLAGLGTVGMSGLFLHKSFGPRVRLGTVFTDCPVNPCEFEALPFKPCIECGKCQKACPSGAILGGSFSPETGRDNLLNPKLCSEFMKKEFQHIGRGAVCGICISICPVGKGRTIKYALPDGQNPQV